MIEGLKHAYFSGTENSDAYNETQRTVGRVERGE